MRSLAGVEPADAQSQARRLTEGLALALQASLMLRTRRRRTPRRSSPHESAPDRGAQYGVLPRGTDAAAIVARH